MTRQIGKYPTPACRVSRPLLEWHRACSGAVVWSSENSFAKLVDKPFQRVKYCHRREANPHDPPPSKALGVHPPGPDERVSRSHGHGEAPRIRCGGPRGSRPRGLRAANVAAGVAGGSRAAPPDRPSRRPWRKEKGPSPRPARGGGRSGLPVTWSRGSGRHTTRRLRVPSRTRPGRCGRILAAAHPVTSLGP